MKRVSVAALAVFILGACGDGGSSASPSESSLEVFAEGEIRQRLKDPESAQFTDVSVYRGGQVTAVCGYVNSKNSFGGMTGRQRFIVAGVTVLEEEVADGGMSDLWAQFCR